MELWGGPTGRELALVAPGGRASAAALHAARRLARSSAAPLRVLASVDEAISLGPSAALVVKERARFHRDEGDRRLCARASAPVLLQAGDVLHPGTVLAAVALRDEAPSALDQSVVRWAEALARWLRANLHVVHAWSVVGESILSCPTRGGGACRTAPLLVRARACKARRLAALLTACDVDPHTPRTLGHGMPSLVLRVAVARTGAGLLAIGHHGETRLGRLTRRPLDVVWRDRGISLLTLRDGWTRPARAFGLERSIA